MSVSDKFILMLSKKVRAYHSVFLNDDGTLKQDAEIVIKDLAKFCRLARPVMVVSPVDRQTDIPATFQAEGRREVALRILAMLRQKDDVARKFMTEETEND